MIFAWGCRGRSCHVLLLFKACSSSFNAVTQCGLDNAILMDFSSIVSWCNAILKGRDSKMGLGREFFFGIVNISSLEDVIVEQVYGELKLVEHEVEAGDVKGDGVEISYCVSTVIVSGKASIEAIDS
ncbi:hypothetical protein HAX54_043479 [Datura stramonium]|uniref:Uncharacterized protein n=1 Tax=Datura stramonium TaxID=4076 RepID=A0ABS8SPI5_DATST|nr:hypothetical protein [Datura stramonium]